MTSLQRYGGEALPDSPHIVVLGSCKVFLELLLVLLAVR